MSVFAYIALIMIGIYGIMYMIGFALSIKETWKKSTKFKKVVTTIYSIMDTMIYILAIFECITLIQ